MRFDPGVYVSKPDAKPTADLVGRQTAIPNSGPKTACVKPSQSSRLTYRHQYSFGVGGVHAPEIGLFEGRRVMVINKSPLGPVGLLGVGTSHKAWSRNSHLIGVSPEISAGNFHGFPSFFADVDCHGVPNPSFLGLDTPGALGFRPQVWCASLALRSYWLAYT